MYSERFLAWANSASEKLQKLNFECTVNVSAKSLDEKCSYIDVESDNLIIKMVGWESGEIGVDAITFPDGITIFVQKPHDNQSYESKLTAYMSQLVFGFTLNIKSGGDKEKGSD